MPHALYRVGAAAGVRRNQPRQPTSEHDLLGGEWLGVDQIDTEASHGLRVNGLQSQDIDPMGREFDELGLSCCSPEQAEVWSADFTGNGRDYFRIWALGWLVTVLTLGLGYPWARSRKLRYLYNHTEVAGHTLDFHGQPRNMLRGFLISGVLLLTYVCAGQWTPWAGALAVVAVAAIWPALYLAAMQFRLAHTSWHGLPFGFSGRLSGAYLALSAPLLISGWALLSMAWGVESGDFDNAWGWTAGGLWLLFVVGLPFFYWQLKNYQHAHLRLGPLQMQWKATPSMIYGLLLRTALLWVLGAALIAAVVALAALSVGGSFSSLLQNPLGNAGVLIFSAVMLLIDTLLARIYLSERMQNLVWSKTGNRYVRLRSDLPLLPYLRLQLSNYALIALTLGVYWPWAKVATRRMRLQAITVVSRVVPDDLISSVQTREGSAAAEVGTELLRLDLGW